MKYKKLIVSLLYRKRRKDYKLKPGAYTCNVGDWDRYYRELVGYMLEEKFKKEYDRYKRRIKKAA